QSCTSTLCACKPPSYVCRRGMRPRLLLCSSLCVFFLVCWSLILACFLCRFYVSVCCCRLARVCLEESIKYALRRKTWNKSLSEHQGIRMKIASMARAVEQLQN